MSDGNDFNQRTIAEFRANHQGESAATSPARRYCSSTTVGARSGPAADQPDDVPA